MDDGLGYKYGMGGGCDNNCGLFIGEYCIDRTVRLLRHLGIPVRTDACPWPVDGDGADMPELDAFDALAWHSSRPFCAPSSTSSSGFETRS